jgi:peptide/nickel transport system substrate-binding protein
MDAEKIALMLRMFPQGGISRRDFIWATAAGAASSLALRGAAGAQAKKPPKEGGTLIYGMEGPSDILDPQATGCWLTYRVTIQMFEGLLAEDLTRDDVAVPPILPKLAESWQVSPDSLTRTFKLRQGVKFHDGTPFDAHAAVFSWERMYKRDAPHFYPRANSYTAYVAEYLTGAEALDAYTLKLTFSKPYAEWERMTLQSWGEPLMISPAAVKKYGNEKFADHPVGTGPFKFVENIPGDRIVLERFKDYWGSPANVDRLVFKRLDDPAARVAALRTGEVDFILAPPPDDVESLRREGFMVLQSDAPHVWYWHLNMQDEHFKDVRVRQAVQMAIDKEKMAKELLKGTAKAAWSMLPPACSAYNPDYKPYSYNPEKAKQLLTEAGYPNGFGTVFWTSTSGSGQMIPVPMAEWIQRDLAKVGIRVKLETFDWITYMAKMFQGLRPGHGAYQQSWGMTTNFWIDIITRSTRQPPKGVNVGWYANPKVDQLLDRGREETDEARRAAIYREVDRILMGEDAAFLPIVNDLNLVILNPKVKGFINPPEEWFQLWTAYLEET